MFNHNYDKIYALNYYLFVLAKTAMLIHVIRRAALNIISLALFPLASIHMFFVLKRILSFETIEFEIISFIIPQLQLPEGLGHFADLWFYPVKIY